MQVKKIGKTYVYETRTLNDVEKELFYDGYVYAGGYVQDFDDPSYFYRRWNWATTEMLLPFEVNVEELGEWHWHKHKFHVHGDNPLVFKYYYSVDWDEVFVCGHCENLVDLKHVIYYSVINQFLCPQCFCDMFNALKKQYFVAQTMQSDKVTFQRLKHQYYSAIAAEKMRKELEGVKTLKYLRQILKASADDEIFLNKIYYKYKSVIDYLADKAKENPRRLHLEKCGDGFRDISV